MKKLTTTLFATAISTAFFTGAVIAGSSNIYGGFANGNPDLYPRSDHSGKHSMVTASQPGVGDSYSPYQGGWAHGNSDLTRNMRGETVTSEFPNIYHSFADNPDLK